MKKCAILFLASALSAFAAGPELKVSVLEGDVLCVRPGRVMDDFAEQLRAAQPTNQVAGTVLDLRFADGDSGSTSATEKYFSSQNTPLMILVNGQTRGAAAALAARLRELHAGVVIGSTNPPGKIQPDLAVTAGAEDERKFQENPYEAVTNRAVSLSATNELLPFVDHMSEADLVRRKIKDGEGDAESETMPRPEPPPVIRDPALARAVDLLKALAVLRQSRG